MLKLVYFSIVIPNYNSGEFLSRALQSVINQTFSNWEVIVVDNESSDASRHAVEQIGDPRITQVQIENHGVIAISRNRGIEMARGEFVAFLDADDWWKPNKLEEMHRVILQEGSDLVYHRLKRAPARKWLRPNVGSRYRGKNKNLLRSGNRIPNSGVVARRTLLEKVGRIDTSPSLIAAEDFDLWIRLYENGAHLSFSRKILGYYYESPGSANNESRRVHSALALIEKHELQQLPGWLCLAIELGRQEDTILSMKRSKGFAFVSSFTGRLDPLLFWVLVARRTVASKFSTASAQRN